MNTPIRPMSLRCKYRAEPLGIDAIQPRFSWNVAAVAAESRGGKQLAYHILASSSRDILGRSTGDLWDSCEVTSARTTHISYAGNALSSAQQVWWKVRILLDSGWTEWSDPASFTMGLLKRDDWTGKWIGTDHARYESKSLPIFRREFSVEKVPTRALVFVCGLGQFELHVNGQKVGDNELDPGWTNYHKTCLYVSHDVTALLRPGANALGIMLGNGMYSVTGNRYKKFKASFGPLKFILQMQLTFSDGSSTTIASDESWKASPGPIVFSCIFGGEDFDASQLQRGWDLPAFDDHQWTNAAISDAPGGELRSQSAPPIKVSKRFDSASVSRIGPEAAVYDLGQNFSGWPRVSVRGDAQSNLTLVTGELLDPSGTVSQRSSGTPVSFGYKGDGTARTWRPQFSYTGFRYVEARGDIGSIEKLGGEFIHSSAAVVGTFKCSKPLFNQIHELINAAILSNMQSVLTDCPHREKLGWLEQSYLMGEAVMLNYDVPMLYTKICADMREAQLDDGCVPTIAPEYTKFKGQWEDFSNSPEWGSAAVINPWLMYQQYGDLEILRDNYEMMRRYVEYLHGREQDGIVEYGLSDWYDIGPGDPGLSKLTTKGLTATAIYFLDLQTLQKVSLLLGKTDDAQRFAALAEKARDAFGRRFFDAKSGQYDRGSQTANAMPLALGLVNSADASRVLANLVADIRANNNHVTAGDIGFRFVLDALAEAGRSDVVFDLLSRTDAPSYGAQLAAGATSLTEAWDSNPKNSQNHLMLGHAELWFYRHLAGIQIDLSKNAEKQIVIRPAIVGDVIWAEASYESVFGRISSRWERRGQTINASVEIPFNCSATVYLPATEGNALTESGQPIAKSSDVRVTKVADGVAELMVNAGKYSFGTLLPV